MSTFFEELPLSIAGRCIPSTDFRGCDDDCTVCAALGVSGNEDFVIDDEETLLKKGIDVGVVFFDVACGGPRPRPLVETVDCKGGLTSGGSGGLI
jgi:hypothetical protein